MNNILHNMKSSLVCYGEAIAQVIDAGVSIVDFNQVRVFYVGRWQFPAGVNIEEHGNIIRTTLDSGKSQVLLEKQGHPSCATCTGRDTCKERCEMWAPIIAKGKAIGAIGFICEGKRQEERFKKNWENYLAFLERMAELIAIEAEQRMEFQRSNAVVELLQTVMEKVDSGILVLDSTGRIMRLNRMGRSILETPFGDLEDVPLYIEATGRHVNSESEYLLSDGSKSYVVAGNLHTVNIGSFHHILIFKAARSMRSRLAKGSYLQQFIGISAEIQEVKDKIKTVAASPSSVLICAEDGLGKEIYARAIHDESDRWDKPFIMVSCADLPKGEEEALLFGTNVLANVAGSKGKAGLIESAAGGTLFLDNVHSLSAPIQRRLVQLLEKREIVRLGTSKPKRVNVRVIAATGRELSQLAESDEFSKDLFYLLNVISLHVPPLRKRRLDIRPLAMNFIQHFSKEMGKSVAHISESFWNSVEQYDWPGNARELRSAMEYTVNMVDQGDTLTPELLPIHVQANMETTAETTMELNLEKLEEGAIRQALRIQEEQGLTNAQTAELLGIGVATFYRKTKNFVKK